MCRRVAEGTSFAQFVEDILQFACPRDDRADARDIQFEELSPFKPGFGIVPGLLRCYGRKSNMRQTWDRQPEPSRCPFEIFRE
jgi:hypothetical protein